MALFCVVLFFLRSCGFIPAGIVRNCKPFTDNSSIIRKQTWSSRQASGEIIPPPPPSPPPPRIHSTSPGAALGSNVLYRTNYIASTEHRAVRNTVQYGAPCDVCTVLYGAPKWWRACGRETTSVNLWAR